ncbi:MAG TPA: hypothetical protein VHY31_13155, partial [Streptosporangiaceae bacterium]|nr:hypothetical protein [Streptosporangiaceae bacterium]
SANIAERIMDLLVDWLPFTHPVLRALMDPEDRDSRRNSQQADRAWFAVARTLRARLGPSPPGTTFGDDDDL